MHRSADGAGRGADHGRWDIFYLDLHGVAPFVLENRSRAPITCAAMDSCIPRGRSYGHAMFSVLRAGTHVTPHTGPTNKKIRI